MTKQSLLCLYVQDGRVKEENKRQDAKDMDTFSILIFAHFQDISLIDLLLFV
jgi:hypothetical protein